MLENGRVEIRANQDGKWWSGIFDNFDDLARSGRFAENKKFNVYTSLNPSSRPATNTIKPYQKAVKDLDITRIHRIPFDLDPDRETGTAATGSQVGYAKHRSQILIDMLESLGWTNPIIGMSGNGYHVQYRCDLPNTDEVKTMLIDLYRGLAVRITTAEINFDVTVKNASRIFRMYGTTNRKASRRSYTDFPAKPTLVPADAIFGASEALKPPKPKPAPAKRKRSNEKGFHNFDVVGLFSQMGMYKRSLGDGKHAVTCIQCDRHSDHDHKDKTDTVIWEGEWPQYHCSHAHCEGVSIHDVIDRFA